MRKDPTDWRNGFRIWKETGESPWEAGRRKELPKFAGGKESSFDDTINFLRRHEGFKDTTYLDGNGIPTIGYGFTDSALVKKGKISRAEADKRLRAEIVSRERFLSGLKNWNNLNEGSKTALRSYYYNYPAGFKDTTKFMRAWNAGNYTEAIRQVDAGMNDPKNRGLRIRRLEEQSLLKADPFLQPRKPKSQLILLVETIPVYQPPFKYEPPVSTDYSLTNRAGGMLNAWNGGAAPNYGGASFRMPTLEEFMRTGSIMPITYRQ